MMSTRPGEIFKQPPEFRKASVIRTGSSVQERGDVVSCEGWSREREFFIDNLLVRIHLIVEMILVDRPCAMGV